MKDEEKAYVKHSSLGGTGKDRLHGALFLIKSCTLLHYESNKSKIN